MGVMTPLPSLIVTPHPVTLDGQRTLAAELRTGENLGAFLARTVPDYEGDVWEVRINGVVVPHEVMHRVRPKGGTVIEVRGVVGKTALLIVAMIALTIFTAGVGTAMVAAGYSAMAAGLAQAAIYAVGSLLINKVLGPKPPKPTESDAAAVFNLGGSRNQARPYEPLALLLGSVRIAPDLASNPYSWYEANDQYMAMLMAPGLNVGRIDELYNGDALLSVYEGVQVWHSGFPGMPEQQIPLYSNADTISGGALEAEKGQPSAWVQRTSSPNTIRLKVDMDFMLFDTTSKGKKKDNSETIEVQYKVAGATNWMPFGSYHITSNSQKQQRRSYSLDVHEGQYDVRVRIAGRNTDGKGATSDFTWSTLTSIQTDNASYAGIQGHRAAQRVARRDSMRSPFQPGSRMERPGMDHRGNQQSRRAHPGLRPRLLRSRRTADRRTGADRRADRYRSSAGIHAPLRGWRAGLRQPDQGRPQPR